MISCIASRYRWLRRKATRAYWAARILGVPIPRGENEESGLIMIQIDGLSRTQLERALAKGRMPHLAKLIRRKHFSLETFYSGIPSTTPAVQGEIFFGVKAAVPAFEFLHRDSSTIMRMYESSSADMVEEKLNHRCDDPLLTGGHIYSDIYRAGAARSRYCSHDFAPDEMLRNLHPFKGLLLAVVYAPTMLRMLWLMLVEATLAIADAFKGLYQREDIFLELGFVPARIAVCILLREMIRFRVLVDIERGVRTIHANFLGYDEQSHRRGPSSAFAHWTLLGIDRMIHDIFRAAGHSNYRDYELIIHSDHGQEHSIPYSKHTGRRLKEAVADVFSQGSLAANEVWMKATPDLLGNTLDGFRHLFGFKRPGIADGGPPDPSRQIILSAMGPIGHIYLPASLPPSEMADYAGRLVAEAGIPLVIYRSHDVVAAINRHGSWRLPGDAGNVLGPNHPFLQEAAEDLASLCQHPDAGDVIISGWDPVDKPISFPLENGSHGGPGSEETRGFVLVGDQIQRWHMPPPPEQSRRIRGTDLRNIALEYLGRSGSTPKPIPEAIATQVRNPIRVMTYNVHSCAGLDGKIRPERIARVINQFDPDLVALQEIDSHRPRSGSHDQALLIAGHLRMRHVFHAMFEEENERYGIAVFSKHPFTVVKSGFLTTADPRVLREARGAIWIRLETDNGTPIHFINTHFGLGRSERWIQTEELLGNRWLGAIPPAEPIILCGDFNSRPRSRVVKRIRDRFQDAQLSATGHIPRATFSSIRPMLRIDHVFVSPHFSVKHVEVPDTPAARVASDHRPVCAELNIQSLP